MKLKQDDDDDDASILSGCSFSADRGPEMLCSIALHCMEWDAKEANIVRRGIYTWQHTQIE